jgi:hypothetical protein
MVQLSRNGQHAADVVSTRDPDVVPKAERRRFTAEHKLRILAEGVAELPEGAPDNVVRTVSENARTLRFKVFGFEES